MSTTLQTLAFVRQLVLNLLIGKAIHISLKTNFISDLSLFECMILHVY